MATFYNVPRKNIPSSGITYLTSTSDSTIILSILVANVNGASASDITVNMLDNANVNVATLAYTVTVPADANVELLANKLILSSGYKLQFLSSTSGTLDTSISYVEV